MSEILVVKLGGTTIADQRQVLDLVALLEPTPFDPSMSPWDITLIEGLADGRAALYLRAHHSLVDGSHGVSVMRSMLDESAAHPQTEESAERSQRRKGPGHDNVVGISSAPGSRRKPGTVSVTIDVAGAMQPIARGAANGFAAALRIDPLDTVVRGVQRSLEVANSVSRQVVVTGGRMSPLSPSRSINTRFETL